MLKQISRDLLSSSYVDEKLGYKVNSIMLPTGRTRTFEALEGKECTPTITETAEGFYISLPVLKDDKIPAAIEELNKLQQFLSEVKKERI